MKKFLAVILVALIVAACGSEKDKKESGDEGQKEKDGAQKEQVDMSNSSGLSAEAYMDSLQVLSKQTPNDDLYTDIYSVTLEMHRNHKGNQLTAKALFQSASLIDNYAILDYNNIKKGFSNRALDLTQILVSEYPDFELIQGAYQLQVGILDGELRRTKEAVILYEELIKMYPDDSVNIEIYQERINNIDKDPFAFLKEANV